MRRKNHENPTVASLTFPSFAKNYLGEEVMESVAILAMALEEYETLVREGGIAPEKVLEYLILAGYLEDLPFVGEIGEKLRKHVRDQLKPMVLCTYRDPAIADARIREGILNALLETQGIQGRPLMEHIVFELDKLLQIDQLLSDLSKKEAQVHKLSNEDPLDPANQGPAYHHASTPYLPELLLEDEIRTRRLTQGHRTFLKTMLRFLFFARTLKNLPQRFPPEAIPIFRKEADKCFAQLQGKELRPSDRNRKTLSYRGKRTRAHWMSEYTLFFFEERALYEFCSFVVPFQYVDREGNSQTPDFHCTVSGYTGELVAIAHGYASLREIFQRYNVEPEYEFLRMVSLQALRSALQAGDLIEVNGDLEIEPSTEIVEIAEKTAEGTNGVLDDLGGTALDAQVPAPQPSTRERPVKGLRTTLRNISSGEAQDAFRKLGIKVIEGRSGNNGHIILQQEKPGGSRVSYPLPGNHGSGKGLKNLCRILSRALNIFGIEREEFFAALAGATCRD